MALRVLLADESSTIKKVIQLSLQDFGVDVKSVTVGLDVLSVAKTFRPDIILADVLLAKRSGYEVCHDIKSDNETLNIPVVLVWSGCMEIDEQKARLCGAERRLEKPFDAAMLRQIVQELVPRTQDNPTSAFLKFPKLPPFEEAKKSTPEPIPFSTPVAPPVPQTPVQPSAPKPQIPSQIPEDGALLIDDLDSESSDEWIQQPINPKPHTTPAATEPEPTSLAKNKEDEFTEFSLTQTGIQKPISQPPPVASQHAAVGAPQISEDLMREEIQKWLTQNMPDIAERLIRDEINRLLQESEKTIQGP
jgi:CheY-like chemotaxis protein